jgi:hypothetical protein
MNLLRAKDQLGKRERKERANLLTRPVAADGAELARRVLTRGDGHGGTMASDRLKSKRGAHKAQAMTAANSAKSATMRSG